MPAHFFMDYFEYLGPALYIIQASIPELATPTLHFLSYDTIWFVAAPDDQLAQGIVAGIQSPRTYVDAALRWDAREDFKLILAHYMHLATEGGSIVMVTHPHQFAQLDLCVVPGGLVAVTGDEFHWQTTVLLGESCLS